MERDYAMMVIVAPLMFLITFGSATVVIATMLASHGGKMMAALRHNPRPRYQDGAVRQARIAAQPCREAAPKHATRLQSLVGAPCPA